MTKKCIKCEEEKQIEFFSIKDKKTGRTNTVCKDCVKIYMNFYIKEYRENNKEIIAEKKRNYYLNNKEKYYNGNDGIYNKEAISERNRNYYQKNKSIIAEKSKDYYQRIKNDEDYINKRTTYRKNNKDKINSQIRHRYKNDILYKIKNIIRTGINKSIKKENKYSRTLTILGCSFEDFMLYIENKFEFWMNWENYGKYNGDFNYGWDIDHIIPLSSAKNIEEVIILNHYSNLQPLCSKVNRDIKRNKL